jgi:hypothetical protein
MVWFLWSLTYVTSSREALNASGYTVERFLNEETWVTHTTLFKYALIVPSAAHFLRGTFLSLGFVHAQNDLIIIMFAYPSVLLIIWSLTFLLVHVRDVKRLAFLLSSSLCVVILLVRVVVGMQEILPVCFVWVHLIRRFVLSVPEKLRNRDTISRGRSSSIRRLPKETGAKNLNLQGRSSTIRRLSKETGAKNLNLQLVGNSVNTNSVNTNSVNTNSVNTNSVNTNSDKLDGAGGYRTGKPQSPAISPSTNSSKATTDSELMRSTKETAVRSKETATETGETDGVRGSSPSGPSHASSAPGSPMSNAAESPRTKHSKMRMRILEELYFTEKTSLDKDPKSSFFRDAIESAVIAFFGMMSTYDKTEVDIK